MQPLPSRVREPLGQCIGGKADFVLGKGDFEREKALMKGSWQGRWGWARLGAAVTRVPGAGVRRLSGNVGL